MSIEEFIQGKFGHKAREVISYMFVISSSIFWVVGFVYSNENNLGGTQTCLSRYTISIISSYFYARMIDSPWNLDKTQPMIKLMFRGLIFVGHSYVCSIVQFYIPLNLFHILGCTGPIFTFLVNYLVNGIVTTKRQMIGVGLSALGLILVINGQFLYSLIDENYHFESDFTNYRTSSASVKIFVCVIYLVWIFFWSFALVFTKIQEFNSGQMLFSASVLGMVFYGVFFNFQTEKSDSIVYFGSLIWVGVPLTISSYLFTFAFKLTQNAGKASTVLVVSGALVGYIVSYFRYGQKLNIFVLFGTLIICFAVMMVLISKNQLSSFTKEQMSEQLLNGAQGVPKDRKILRSS